MTVWIKDAAGLLAILAGSFVVATVAQAMIAGV